MKVEEQPRFPAAPAQTIRKLTDLFRQFGRAINDLLAWFTDSTTITGAATSTAVSYGTTAVSASGTTITMPTAAAAGLGREVTVILTVPGWVDITRAGADTFEVDGSQTTIRLDNDGASLTLRTISSTAWGIV